MNKLTTFILSLLVALPLWAAEHDNRLYLTVGAINENSQVELSLHLENPTIALTAVELYVTLPDGTSLSAGSLAERAGGHMLTEGAVDGKHFVSVASPELATFTERDGALCSWTIDLSELTAGDYTIAASGLFAVGVADGAVTAYTTDDLQVTLTISDVDTGIATPSAQDGTLRVYTLQGQRIASPQRGQVNIVNGKKRLIQK